ncbi:hypothetical protein IFM89_007781 [Coptis chinensis]|uniref:CCHC-type domain-containing protein n=1 Tax=Coptis chinensis TaxID=261450 RepID=A0A835M906_9MAGN|nr:hypothetical protein IFM89_007781 [Coptis chinensis]
MEKNSGAPPAATGCYKCGRPGHWSRDCPYSKPDSDQLPNSNSSIAPKSSFNNTTKFPFPSKTIEKPKKLPRRVPKLTPEILLSEDGLGYVLRHFPQSFKFHGRGHERVANGGDPSKLHETPVEYNVQDSEPAVEEARKEDHCSDEENPLPERHDYVDVLDEEMPDEIYTKATQEPSQSSQTEMTNVQALADNSILSGSPKPMPDNAASLPSEIQITEEQRARMEASRLKALEKRAARALSSHAD